MTPTPATDCGTDWTVVVGIRVPASDRGDLASCASRRLARTDGVDAVTAAALRGIEPGLAATAITLEVEVQLASPVDAEGVAAVLVDGPGVQRVDEVWRSEF